MTDEEFHRMIVAHMADPASRVEVVTYETDMVSVAIKFGGACQMRALKFALCEEDLLRGVDWIDIGTGDGRP